MKNDLQKYNLTVILIQIDEAHSTAWPVGLEKQLPHTSLQDRINRANYFVNKYNPPYHVFIDNWNNEFANLFRAWPDKFHCVDRTFKLISKSEYGMHEDALIDKDCIKVLMELMID